MGARGTGEKEDGGEGRATHHKTLTGGEGGWGMRESKGEGGLPIIRQWAVEKEDGK